MVNELLKKLGFRFNGKGYYFPSADRLMFAYPNDSTVTVGVDKFVNGQWLSCKLQFPPILEGQYVAITEEFSLLSPGLYDKLYGFFMQDLT